MMPLPAVSETTGAIRRNLRLGYAATAVLVFGIGGWAAFTEISGAVVTQGLVVVESDVKRVQHPTGGVVGELRVREGSRVESGDILIRLDETQTRSTLAIITKSLDELAARQARNEAERDGADAISFPQELLDRADDPQVARVLDGERKLFTTRRSAREGQKAQLRERIAQLAEEVRGVTAQEEAKVSQIDWIKEELRGVRQLWEKNLIPFTRVTALERDAARLVGERGQAIAVIAQSKGKISEIELQILQIDQDMRTEVGKELADIRGRTAELAERRIAAEDQLRRIDIRAPQSGFVHQLSVHTVGGVVAPGEHLMRIVPEGDDLSVDAKVPPQEIDQLRLGQAVTLKFSAFNLRTTPELKGSISRISADVSHDEKTGLSYYTTRIVIPNSEIARLNGLRLVPGMPVEVFVQTPARTVLSYLVKPLSDQLARSFREK